MIDYEDAVEVIHRERGNAVTVTTMTQTRHWGQVSSHRDLDIGIANGMGKASSVGLGIALGAPDRRVLVLDGDGSLLMNLGSLVTVASQSPENFYHFVFQNDVYAVTGGQPVPGGPNTDYVGLAKAAGYRDAWSFDDLEVLASELPGIMAQAGPVLVALRVNTILPAMPGDQTWESNARMPAAFRSVRAALAPDAE